MAAAGDTRPRCPYCGDRGWLESPSGDKYVCPAECEATKVQRAVVNVVRHDATKVEELPSRPLTLPTVAWTLIEAFIVDRGAYQLHSFWNAGEPVHVCMLTTKDGLILEGRGPTMPAAVEAAFTAKPKVQRR